MRSKLCGGIGVAVCHSSPSESQGFAGAFTGLIHIEYSRLNKKIRNERPSKEALTEEKSLSACRFFAYVKTRRGWPSSPRMNIGKKVRLKNMNIVQKWASPSFLFIILPDILGIQ